MDSDLLKLKATIFFFSNHVDKMTKNCIKKYLNYRARM